MQLKPKRSQTKNLICNELISCRAQSTNYQQLNLLFFLSSMQKQWVTWMKGGHLFTENNAFLSLKTKMYRKNCYVKLWIGVRPFVVWSHPIRIRWVCAFSLCCHKNSWPFVRGKVNAWCHCCLYPMNFPLATEGSPIALDWCQCECCPTGSGWHMCTNCQLVALLLTNDFVWNWWDLQKTLDTVIRCKEVDLTRQFLLISFHNHLPLAPLTLYEKQKKEKTQFQLTFCWRKNKPFDLFV